MSWHESNIEEIGPQSPLRVTLREGNNQFFGRNDNVLVGALKGAGMGAATGGIIGGISGGISAARSGNYWLNGKTAEYEVNLDNFTLVSQGNDPMNCKNCTLESIEKMNGGSRTKDYFREYGDAFLKDNPNASLEEYFEHFGFRIENPEGWTHKQIGRAMELGHPTVVNENISVDRGHTLAITKIRQWTPNSNVKVWFGDPARGVWKTNWNTMANPNFNQGNYLFYLR
jgi:hypothetical protein